MYHHTDITIPRPSSMHFTMKKGVNFLIIGGYPISRLFISLLQIHPISGCSHQIPTHGNVIFLDTSRMISQILKNTVRPPHLLIQPTQQDNIIKTNRELHPIYLQTTHPTPPTRISSYYYSFYTHGKYAYSSLS